MTRDSSGTSRRRFVEAGGPSVAPGGWHDAIEQLDFLPPVPDLLDTDRTRDVSTTGRYLDALTIAGENAIPRATSQLEQELRQLEWSA